MSPPEKKIYYTLVAGLLVLTLLMFLFAMSFVRIYRKRSAMFREHLLLELSLVEEERKRIAADLHDDMGSSLEAIKMRLKLLQQMVPEVDMIPPMLQQLDQTTEHVRNIIHNLVPFVLMQNGLRAAIARLVDDLRATTNLTIHADLGQRDVKLIPEKMIILFRVIQEIITNVLKHASASELRIHYAISNRYILLDICDDGDGFDHALGTIISKGGMGLKNIAARLMLLKASYNIYTRKQEGTSYHIKVPLPSIIAYEKESTH